MKIKNIFAREILDSRGFPTVEVDVICENGYMGRASIPSGASTGSNEALELRDNDSRYLKKGVLTAVKNVNTTIKKALIGMDANNQALIDKTMIELDGTENKSVLGANAILGVSLACLKVSARSNNKHLFQYLGKGELPIPMMNIINGGSHADNEIDFQEYMIVPNAKTFKERLRIGAEVFHTLKNVLKEKKYNTNVGDEGGFAPNLKNNIQPLELIVESINKAGYTPGKDVFLALDVAASEFYNKEENKYLVEDKLLDKFELLNLYVELSNKFPIISIEDPFDENDFEGFTMITERIGHKVQIVGDDLFVTNKKLLQKGIDNRACNAILLKLNQIGTVTEMIETIELARKHNYKTVISHRSGETEDTYIADFAVGLDLKQIKTGSLCRSERTAKYNQLLRIEELI